VRASTAGRAVRPVRSPLRKTRPRSCRSSRTPGSCSLATPAIAPRAADDEAGARTCGATFEREAHRGRHQPVADHRPADRGTVLGVDIKCGTLGTQCSTELPKRSSGSRSPRLARRAVLVLGTTHPGTARRPGEAADDGRRGRAGPCSAPASRRGRLPEARRPWLFPTVVHRRRASSGAGGAWRHRRARPGRVAARGRTAVWG